MDKDSPLKDQIAAEASDWIVRLQEAELPPALRAEFVEWLLRSPDHIEEFLAISRVWGETQQASVSRFDADQLIAAALRRSEADNVIALDAARQVPRIDGDEVRGSRAHAARKYRFGTAAAAALVALTAITWLGVDRWLNPDVFRTAVGEQRSITLPDGSIVDINTNSELRVDLQGQQRKLRLVRGEARFKVAKDPTRPFIVATPQATIRALGTIFNVRAESEQTAVAVLEGHVLVREFEAPRAGDIAHIELKAGQQAAVNRTGEIVPAAGPPIERVAQWTNRRLVFREEPLAVVVAEFNRYHRTPIRIEAPQLAGLLISGTFDSSDLNSLLEYFARFENVNVERDDDGIRLSLPSAQPPL